MSALEGYISGFTLWNSPKKIPKILCIKVGYPNIKKLTHSLTDTDIKQKLLDARHQAKPDELTQYGPEQTTKVMIALGTIAYNADLMHYNAQKLCP